MRARKTWVNHRRRTDQAFRPAPIDRGNITLRQNSKNESKGVWSGSGGNHFHRLSTTVLDRSQAEGIAPTGGVRELSLMSGAELDVLSTDSARSYPLSVSPISEVISAAMNSTSEFSNNV